MNEELQQIARQLRIIATTLREFIHTTREDSKLQHDGIAAAGRRLAVVESTLARIEGAALVPIHVPAEKSDPSGVQVLPDGTVVATMTPKKRRELVWTGIKKAVPYLLTAGVGALVKHLFSR